MVRPEVVAMTVFLFCGFSRSGSRPATCPWWWAGRSCWRRRRCCCCLMDSGGADRARPSGGRRCSRWRCWWLPPWRLCGSWACWAPVGGVCSGTSGSPLARRRSSACELCLPGRTMTETLICGCLRLPSPFLLFNFFSLCEREQESCVRVDCWSMSVVKTDCWAGLYIAGRGREGGTVKLPAVGFSHGCLPPPLELLVETGGSCFPLSVTGIFIPLQHNKHTHIFTNRHHRYTYKRQFPTESKLYIRQLVICFFVCPILPAQRVTQKVKKEFFKKRRKKKNRLELWRQQVGRTPVSAGGGALLFFFSFFPFTFIKAHNHIQVSPPYLPSFPSYFFFLGEYVEKATRAFLSGFSWHVGVKWKESMIL